MELGLRLLNWLSGDDDLIAIPAHMAEDTSLDMPPGLAGGIGLFFLIVLPLLLLAAGTVIWWRRRQR